MYAFDTSDVHKISGNRRNGDRRYDNKDPTTLPARQRDPRKSRPH